MQREAQWQHLEETGEVVCPQCDDKLMILKSLKTPYRTSMGARMTIEKYGEELIDAPFCACRQLSEEDRARLKAGRRFDAILKQYGLAYTAFSADVKERIGIVGIIQTGERLLTQSQIEEIERALNSLAVAQEQAG